MEIKAKLQDSLVGRKRTFQLRPFDFNEFIKAKKFELSKNPMTDAGIIKIYWMSICFMVDCQRFALESEVDLKIDLLQEYNSTYLGKDIRHMIVENHVLTFNNLIGIFGKNYG